MAGQKRYSDILADIVRREHSKCTCPPNYFTPSVKPKSPNPNTAGCQFGPDCQFSGPCNDDVPAQPACQYNQAKCTCYAQCICGPQFSPPLQLLHGPELDQAIDTQMCICQGNCYCESEDTLVPRNVYKPTRDCDKTRCVCDVCFCKPDVSESRLLPPSFRNAVKREPQMSSDERIKKECAEIKQLLIEHEENKKKELEESPLANDKVGKKPVTAKVSIFEDSGLLTQPSDNKEDNIDSVVPQEGLKFPDLTIKSLQKEQKELEGSARSKKTSFKKEKTPKKKPRQVKSMPNKTSPSTPSQFTQYSCGCRMPKKKPLHIRYYFAGGTEHYGVKLGHKQCLPKPALVPKNMGWLWNIEDPSKGIRERKGWPPGFIAKNIKNMIKVLKQFDDVAESGSAKSYPQSGTGGRRFGFRRREEGEVGTEPQEEPPLLHIHKKGRTYNITFCPKASDTDIGPIPIPFSITEKRRDSDSSSDDSTLEFEFHSPKPKGPQPQNVPQKVEDNPPEEEPQPVETTEPPPSTTKAAKKKYPKKRSSKSTEENKNLWEEQQTQIENIA